MAPPHGFKLPFTPADYNPYVFAPRPRTKAWKATLGTLVLYLDMEGEGEPTPSEAWSALLADQHVAAHPDALPPVMDRRLALEVIGRRAHVSRGLWGGGVYVPGEMLPAKDVTLVRRIPDPLPMESIKACEQTIQEGQTALGRLLRPKRSKVFDNVPPIRPDAADEFVIKPKDQAESIVAEAIGQLTKRPRSPSSSALLGMGYGLSRTSVEAAAPADDKAAKTAKAMATIDKTLEDIAAFKLRQEVEAEARRRMAGEPKPAPEWAGF